MQSSKMQFVVFCPLQTDMHREKQRIAFAVVSHEEKDFYTCFKGVPFSISVFYEIRPEKYFSPLQNQIIFYCLGLHKTIKLWFVWEPEILTAPLPPPEKKSDQLSRNTWQTFWGKLQYCATPRNLTLQFSSFPLSSVARAGKIKGRDVQDVKV